MIFHVARETQTLKNINIEQVDEFNCSGFTLDANIT